MDEASKLRRLERLARKDDRAEWELDLTGLDEIHARASVEKMVERNRFGEPKQVLIRFAPARPGGGETLFQPIGRLLVECMKRGWVTRVQPLSVEIGGGGFYVELPGKPEREHPPEEPSPNGAG